MAQLVGVRANWVISSAFAITGLMAGVVALLYVLPHGRGRRPTWARGRC